MPHKVVIEKLGAQGDGVAAGSDGPLFVPFALPDERVRIEQETDGKHARLLTVESPSPDRIDPVCPHFGVCGGCALQHLAHDVYLAWKREAVVHALQSRGLDTEVEAVRPVRLGSRRRATFTLGLTEEGLALGYHRARSHDLIDIDVCPILSPDIVARLPRLKAALAPLLGAKREVRVSVTETGTGLDVVVEGVKPRVSALTKLAAEGASLGVARITAGGESIIFVPPTVSFGSAEVKLPPGAFLQASPQAEAVLSALVCEGTGKAKRIADLFAGLGTFALALARTSAVDAYETDETALNALAEAARHTSKLKPVRTFRRDLFGTPLGARELNAYDAVVFDPPRAGAAAQAEQIAKSNVKRVVAVSCNPGTLARDLRLLADGGYRINRIAPVDQFLFSSHVEVVAHLTR